MFDDQGWLFGWSDLRMLSLSGGRSSQAIVDGAMNALRALVKERLSGKSGGSGYSKQVRCSRAPLRLLHFIVAVIWNLKVYLTCWAIFNSRAAAAATRRMWWCSPTTTLTRWCCRVTMCGWWSFLPRGVDTARSELNPSHCDDRQVRSKITFPRVLQSNNVMLWREAAKCEW